MKELTCEEKNEIIDAAFIHYKGNFNEFNAAVGVFYLGFKVGWKPLYLIHSRSSLKKYEKILAINFFDTFPEVGIYANKSAAWGLAFSVSNFWKAVKGEIKGMRSPLCK